MKQIVFAVKTITPPNSRTATEHVTYTDLVIINIDSIKDNYTAGISAATNALNSMSMYKKIDNNFLNTAGQPAEHIEIKESGGYAHLNNIVNPEYFKELENNDINIDTQAGVASADNYDFNDSHFDNVNCDVLSSLLVS
jgi:hypothetical protein